MSKMRLRFEKNHGRAQVSNGLVAVEATWTDPEYGLDGETAVTVTLSGADAKHLESMSGEELVLYNDSDQVFSCGSFVLAAGKPSQKAFAFMDDALDGALKGLSPKGVKGVRFNARQFKLFVDLVSKFNGDIPLVFYGDRPPVCCEVEKGEVGFKFLISSVQG